MGRGVKKIIDYPPRALLYYAGIVIQLIASAISGIGFLLENQAWFLGGAIAWAIWFVIMFIMVRPATDWKLLPGAGILERGGIALFAVLFTLGVLEILMLTILYPRVIENSDIPGEFGEVISGLERTFDYNDSTVLIQQASENLLEGKNPYAHANIVEGLQAYNGIWDRLTPVRTGRFAESFPYPSTEELQAVWNEALEDPAEPPPEIISKVSYPAGSFLLPAPFIAAGIKDIRIIFGIFAAGAVIYGLFMIPGKRKIIFTGGVLISLELWNSVFAGETSMLLFPFLLIAWLACDRRPWLSAICMGIAVATKQTAWFILPFYLVMFLHTQGLKKTLGGLGVTAGIFIAMNLPFIIAGGELWLQSVASPMSDPLFPLGVGIITLVTGGIIDVQSSLPFTIAEFTVMLGGLAWYYRYGKKHPHAGLILSVLPLFFAWRSLWNYFYYVGLIAFAAILAGTGQRNMLNNHDVLNEGIEQGAVAQPKIDGG